MTQYNIYFGTIGKTLGCKYHFTKWCKNEQEAINIAESSAKALFCKYEGKYGIPSFKEINEESKITGLDIETLYSDHVKDFCRWHVIPTEFDTISSKKLRY